MQLPPHPQPDLYRQHSNKHYQLVIDSLHFEYYFIQRHSCQEGKEKGLRVQGQSSAEHTQHNQGKVAKTIFHRHTEEETTYALNQHDGNLLKACQHGNNKQSNAEAHHANIESASQQQEREDHKDQDSKKIPSNGKIE